MMLAARRMERRYAPVATIATVATVAALLAFAVAYPRSSAQSTEGDRPVVVVDLEGEVSEAMPSAVDRAADEAEESDASHLVLRIRTFGGLVTSAAAIQDRLLEAEVPVVAFVDGRAISAGALIALASEAIYMAPGAQIGAAAPRQIGPGDRHEPADEKTVSALRSMFRAAAEARGHDPALAEAMVDPDVEIADVSPSGELLTLTTGEAVDLGLAEAEAASVDELAAQGAIGSGERIEMALSPAERLADFLSHPLVAALLLSLAIFALIFAFAMPGAGLPEVVAALAFGGFLFGNHVAGLAGWEDVALVIGGIVLLAVEIFVIPGLGIAAVLGVVALGAGLVMAGIGHSPASPFFWEEFRQAIAMLGVAVGLGALWSALAYFSLRKTALWKRFAKRSTLAPESEPGEAEADEAQKLAALEGRTGSAKTSLRPQGEVEIGGETYPARAERGYIDPRTPVAVVAHEVGRVVVREAPDRAPDGDRAPGEDGEAAEGERGSGGEGSSSGSDGAEGED